MKKITFILTLSGLLLGFNSSAETILKCAVKKIPTDGARINLLQKANGDLRANLIFGTTVSGTMYNIEEVNPGIYQGTIKGNKKFWIKLAVSSVKKENHYIRGYESSIKVVYPDLRKKSGFGTFESAPDNDFVCGEQIRGYRE